MGPAKVIKKSGIQVRALQISHHIKEKDNLKIILDEEYIVSVLCGLRIERRLTSGLMEKL